VNTRREGKRLLAELSSPQIKEACHHMRSILKSQGRNHRSA
jgi:hypothetical protein